MPSQAQAEEQHFGIKCRYHAKEGKEEWVQVKDWGLIHACSEGLDWHGLYNSDAKYKKFVHPDSNAHPAKISFALCNKIIKHLEVLGLLKEGNTILDFMSGTNRVGVVAELNGYPSIAVELEQNFTDMIEKNREVLKRQIQREPKWVVIKGDSRRLASLLAERGLVGLTSPPYADVYLSGGDQQAREERMLVAGYDPKTMLGGTARSGVLKHYPTNPSNIGNLKDSELIAITSPPYSKAEDGGGIFKKGYNGPKHAPTDLVGKRTYANSTHNQSEGNIANLPDNISNQSETYLAAMYRIYQQASQVCKVIVCVTKNPTRAGKLRRLDLSTAELLQQSHFKIVDYHRAILFNEATQKTLAGGQKRELHGHLSFFKRLSVQGGNITAQWEDIIIAVKR